MDLCYGSVIVILIMVAPSVILHSIDDWPVSDCQAATKAFTANEPKYVDRRQRNILEEPDNIGFQIEELLLQTSASIRRQRVFECISERIDSSSKQNLKTNPKYQAIVSQCKSEQTRVRCDPAYPYRTINGTCNNLQNPKWGSVLNCLRRSLPARYEGVSGFRQSVCGGPLPHPRFLSLNVHQDENRPTQDVTHMFTFFGQLLTHDVTDVPVTFVGDQRIDCCSHPKGPQHPQCAPIMISKDDPFYSQRNITCFNFVRSVICDTCSIGKRITMSQATALIDLSFAYGLSDTLASDLRTNRKGKLKTQHTKKGDLCPRDYEIGICGNGKKDYCFLTGDRRVHINPIMMSLQTLFVLEHNRIADKLKQLNPHWKDEIIYQEARKINIAQMQAITYKEYLPTLLGSNLMTRYGLWLRDQSCTAYNPKVDTTLRVEFNTAAFRLHSMINNIFSVYDTTMRVRNSTLDVEPMYQGKMGSVLQGTSLSPSQKYDRFVTTDMTDFVYGLNRSNFGFDIASLHIQRGRDNGLPTYVEMIQYLSKGATNIKNFEDLNVLMDQGNIDLLEDKYCDVLDIDLWVGLTNERVPAGMTVGPTAAEIIAQQFSDLKHGDRFYFEHCGNFNEQQLSTLKTTTLSSLMCLNTNIEWMQSNAFLFPSDSNPTMFCNDIPEVDLNQWKSY